MSAENRHYRSPSALFACFAIIGGGETMATATGSNLLKRGSTGHPLTLPSARDSAWKRSSIGRGEIVDDLASVGILDRRAIDLDHLRHFGLPEVLVEPARLGTDVVGGVAGWANVLHHIHVWSPLGRSGFVRERVANRSRVRRTESQACDGGGSEEQ